MIETCIISTLSIIVLMQYINKKRTNKELTHQRALVSVLRHRLGDKQDNSNPFTENELKEINCWSGRLLHDIYLVKHYNRNANSPMVDNTTEPPKGTPIVYNMKTRKERNT